MPTVSNSEFLTAIFCEDAQWTHVTDFTYDPDDIPTDRHLHAWKGDYFNRYQFGPISNQYFTISHFFCDKNETARRRKVLFRHTRVIVLDDVKEKLSMVEVQKLPAPSWILETSKGSEQWGYILNEPCTDRAKIENLLDGLVANGLAPEGRDPGMKGVTRYVRLPEGYNLKAKRYIDGQPWLCQMTEWNPQRTVTLEQLAEPFMVNLNASRREARIDGAKDVADHPILQIADIIAIKEVRSEGRFDITCPWVDEHTDEDDSGAAIFTNGDGTIGFKCHHGACQTRTGKHLLTFIEGEVNGFGVTFNNWKTKREFAAYANKDQALVAPPAPTAVSSQSVAPPPPVVDNVAPVPPVDTATSGMDDFLNLFALEHPGDKKQELASKILQMSEELPPMKRIEMHAQMCHDMHWTKVEFKIIMASLREEWYQAKSSGPEDFFGDMIYVAEMNKFFDRKKRMFLSPEAYQNMFGHLDGEAKKEALQNGRVMKVDRIDYAPKMPVTFQERGVVYGNSWYHEDEPLGMPGDVSRWIDHFDILGWGEYREHIMQWMAFTILYPEIKINHAILMGSGEGCGKDFLLAPLQKAMIGHTTTIAGEDLIDNFNEYLLSTKYLHINEIELGTHAEAASVYNKLKRMAATPPDTLRVNEKMLSKVNIRNIINISMTTNSMTPLRMNGPSRRFFAVWSDLNTRDARGQQTEEWNQFWVDRWTWMLGGGAEACIHYLRTQVDLSNFNPMISPPVTEFLREIQDSSKSAMEQTIEGFIENKIGNLAADLVTTLDMVNTLKMGDIGSAATFMVCNADRFNMVTLGRELKKMPGILQIRIRHEGRDLRVWALRDGHRYQMMSPADLHREYQRQSQEDKSMMRVVK